MSDVRALVAELRAALDDIRDEVAADPSSDYSLGMAEVVNRMRRVPGLLDRLERVAALADHMDAQAPGAVYAAPVAADRIRAALAGDET